MQIERSLRVTLSQLHQVLSGLSSEEYSAPLSVLSNSSIGQHARHILEFFQTLTDHYATGIINYDKRKRNTLLETDLQFALEELSVIVDDVSRKDKEVILVGCYSSDSGDIIVKNTYHRELVYNLEHAIHHMAMIKIGIRESTDLSVPAEFGVAAATIQHRQSAKTVVVKQK